MQPSTQRLLALLLLTNGACNDNAPPARTHQSPPPPKTTAVEPPAPKSAPVIQPLPSAPPTTMGMEDPFGRLKQDDLGALNAGYRALRQKRPSEARESFHAVVAAHPDQVGARYEELRATVAEGDFEAVPALWRTLLERDFVGYAERLERSKEMAELRASPTWATVQTIKAEVKARYIDGLTKGFVFVARSRPHGPPTFAGSSDSATLDPGQEVYHFDPTSKRFRRVTDTGGHVVALHRQGNKLVLFTARTLRKVEAGAAFSKPDAMLLSLDTLETAGPISIDGDARSAELCFSSKGEPIWSVKGAVETRALTLDATGSALVTLDESCGAAAVATLLDPTGVQLRRAVPEGVALSADGTQLTGVDADKPVRASQAIRAGSLSWSPGKKRFAFVGQFDRCQKDDDKQKATPASLVVWDATQKKAARVSAGPAVYETEWLDDDHLVYEQRTGGSARLVIEGFTAGDPSLTMKTPAGAGLFGMPTVPCANGELALAR